MACSDRVGLEAVPVLRDVAPGAMEQLARASLGDVEDLGDLGEGEVERLAQDEHAAFGRGELLQHVQGGDGHRLAQLERVEWTEHRRVGQRRLGEPRTDIALPGHARRGQLVEGETRDHRGEEGGRLTDLRVLDPQPSHHRLRHDVLGVPHAAEQPVGDAEESRAMAEELVGRADARHRVTEPRDDQTEMSARSRIRRATT